MLTTNFRGIFAVVFAALLLAGCSSTQQEEADPNEGMTTAPPVEPAPAPAPEPEPPKPTVTSGSGGKGKLVVPLDGTMDVEELDGVFYFDFDQAIVKRAAYQELQKHAKALAGDRSLSVRIEGHADERGTREYNLALGERRANAVRAYLMTHGAMSSQLETISYGEEKPAVNGSNERAWAMNRRVELDYKR